jgi:hypothetical protein
MIAARVKKILHPTKGTLPALRRFIGSKNIPLELRRLAITTILLPGLCYGGELFGMQQLNGKRNDLLWPLEKILDSALWMMSKASWNTRLNQPALMSNRVLRQEYRISSVEACMGGRAARVVAKYGSSQCPIYTLFKYEPTKDSKQNSWRLKIDTNLRRLLNWYGIGVKPPSMRKRKGLDGITAIQKQQSIQNNCCSWQV